MKSMIYRIKSIFILCVLSQISLCFRIYITRKIKSILVYFHFQKIIRFKTCLFSTDFGKRKKVRDSRSLDVLFAPPKKQKKNNFDIIDRDLGFQSILTSAFLLGHHSSGPFKSIYIKEKWLDTHMWINIDNIRLCWWLVCEISFTTFLQLESMFPNRRKIILFKYQTHG